MATTTAYNHPKFFPAVGSSNTPTSTNNVNSTSQVVNTRLRSRSPIVRPMIIPSSNQSTTPNHSMTGNVPLVQNSSTPTGSSYNSQSNVRGTTPPPPHQGINKYTIPSAQLSLTPLMVSNSSSSTTAMYTPRSKENVVSGAPTPPIAAPLFFPSSSASSSSSARSPRLTKELTNGYAAALNWSGSKGTTFKFEQP